MIEGFLISHFFASVYVHVQERHCEKIQTLVVRVLGGPTDHLLQSTRAEVTLQEHLHLSGA